MDVANRCAGSLVCRLMLPSVAAMVLLLGAVYPALASNWGSTGSAGVVGTTNAVSLLPDRTMTVKRVELTSSYSNAVFAIVTDRYNPTDLVASVGANTNSCPTSDRICVFDHDYGNNNLYGWTACHSGSAGSNPSRTCAHQWVRLNLFYTPPSSSRLVCHELGHTVGLRHGGETNSCVYSPIADSTTTSLTTQDVNHINAHY